MRRLAKHIQLSPHSGHGLWWLGVRNSTEAAATGRIAKGTNALNRIAVATVGAINAIAGVRFDIGVTPPALTVVAAEVIEIL